MIHEIEQEKYNAKLNEFEKNFSYPLGNDRFTISHGKNYFQFFNNLGQAFHVLALHDDRIVASVAIVQRKLIRNEFEEIAYYLCDLKILNAYRGKNIIQEFIKFARQFNVMLPTDKCYSVSMDSGNHNVNRLSKITSRMQDLNLELGGRLLIYLIDQKTLKTIETNLNQHFGSYEFKSLKGVKDLILQSTGQALNFVHLFPKKIQEDPFQPPFDIKTASYMFCLPEGSCLVEELHRKEVEHFATASILQKNMDLFKWNFITTGEV